MTLRCARCGSYALAFTAQSYTETTLFEGYECEHCGATGSLTANDNTGISYTEGAIESDGEVW
ncbi:hypothetical protein [Halococcus saccharolyticus]|uniref:Uncharacterized protein n=1 Tax=Halococcus saccharolyticus DSM 5350 TaxID=1227455 RepID=M0MFX7_9EURY|nr:hypothetical protein [Halococcus saccharolyticus]EMA44268.1 hypothetical protein C449_12098 [Halococcus saccharolyticus DSM 5350]